MLLNAQAFLTSVNGDNKKKLIWRERYRAVNDRIVSSGIPPDSHRREFSETFRTTEPRFLQDYDAAQRFLKETSDLPSPANVAAIRAHSENYSQRLDALLDSSKAFSIPALSAAYLQNLTDSGLEIDPDDPLISVVLGTGILASIPNSNEFHNNAHFREVTLNAIKLIKAMTVYEGQEFSFEDTALILIACHIHDIFHNGENNYTYDKDRNVTGYVPCKIEKNSFVAAEAYLDELGLKRDQKRIVRAALIGTEVFVDLDLPQQNFKLLKPDGTPMVLSRSLLASLAYEHHFHGGEKPVLPAGLSIFLDSVLGERATRIGAVVNHGDVMGSFYSRPGFRKRGLQLVTEATRTRIKHHYSANPQDEDMKGFAQYLYRPDANNVSMPAIRAERIMLGPLLYEIQGQRYAPSLAAYATPAIAR